MEGAPARQEQQRVHEFLDDVPRAITDSLARELDKELSFSGLGDGQDGLAIEV
jgi:hypothetical protein